MKYMVMMFGEAASMLETQPTEWVREMIQFMHDLNDDLVKRGELVSAEGLTDGTEATTVRYENDAVVAGDGPFADSKQSIIGYWIVDVDSEQRAVDIARQVVGFTHGPIEVRRVAEGPPEV
jgi:hypothetical protein